jgi:hypothetical protein
MIVKNSRGEKMIINEDDLHLLKPNRKHPGCYYFSFNSSGYFQVTRNCKKILFHHLVIGKPPKGLVTDHLNRVRNDNRKSNLRHITPTQNLLNRAKFKNSNSKFHGVHFCKRDQKFKAQIKVNGKTKHIAQFPTELQAAKSYDRYVIENNLPQQLNFNYEAVAKVDRI